MSIFTEPSITGWAGHSVNLQCAFIGTPQRVLWNRVQGEPETKSVETVLRYTSDGYEVLGDRRYSWSDNYGLIIRDLRVLDEGNFTCMVSKTGGAEIHNTTVLAVYGERYIPFVSKQNKMKTYLKFKSLVRQLSKMCNHENGIVSNLDVIFKGNTKKY